jgi:hypothetical protein
MRPSIIITILTLSTFALGLVSVHYNQSYSYLATLAVTAALSFWLPRIDHLSET